MKENISAEQTTLQVSDNVTLFGYELLRADVLPELLGKDTAELLYWSGKRLAGKYPLNSLDEIIDFFARASWGELELKKQNTQEMEFEMTSALIFSRVKSKSEHFFQLEAGFLARQIEGLKGAVTEAFEHPIKRSQKVLFTVKWDPKDSI
ncbi:MAG: YslB family protein [Bacillota bacterium]|nr:YslB family protein [Bacillota bacterium]